LPPAGLYSEAVHPVAGQTLPLWQATLDGGKTEGFVRPLAIVYDVVRKFRFHPIMHCLKAILLGMGLQNKSVDSIASEIDLPSSQVSISYVSASFKSFT